MKGEKTLSKLHLAVISVTAIILLVIVIMAIGRVGDDTVPDDMATVSFDVLGGYVSFGCQVADDYLERQQGLMGVESMPESQGMLFVFESPKEVSFWMKDTLIPLDIIFINQSGYVVNIEQADPEPGVPDSQLTSYESDGPVIWVVELNQGVCAQEDIVPGTQVDAVMP